LIPPPKNDPNAPWRWESCLYGQFHPECPDDVQVIVHDGEPRRTGRRPEVCWVTIIAMEPPIQRVALHSEATRLSKEEFDARYNIPFPVFVGRMLNAPHALSSVKQGESIRFIMSPGLEYPLHVSSDYLRERPRWGVSPCGKCGASECLDPPTVMFHTRFPSTPPDAIPEMFTAFCAFCGGTQLLSDLSRMQEALPAPPLPSAAPDQKPWWKFW
jgi:hypothetical protein